MAEWFFFSYARGDWDEHLEKFFQDLAREVSTLKPNIKAGFLDQRSIELGEVWDLTLREALRSTPVFVSICSPTYFTREYCGKEVQICFDRLPREAQTTSFIPVLWQWPSRSTHPAVNRFQQNHLDLPAAYHEHGLRHLMRLNTHRDDYELFLNTLTRKIVNAGESSPLVELRSLPDFDRIGNVFSALPAQPAAPQGSGWTRDTKDAAFAYVSTEGKYWKPFHPDSDESVALAAMDAARKHKLIYNDLPVDGHIVKRVKEAEERKEVVIIVVDPRSVKVNTYEQHMRDYDEHNYLNSAVLVVWNSQAGAAGEDLQKQVARTFRYRAGSRKSVYYVDSITSQLGLQSALAKTIAKLRNSLIEHSDARQRIENPELLRNAQSQGIDPSRQPTVGSPGESPR